MKKIKILRIIARLNIGGPAQNAVLLSESLSGEDFETLLIAGLPERYEGDMAYLAKEKNIRFQIVPQLSREIHLVKDVVACWKIFRIILREKPNVIHTHTAKAGALGRISGILFNIINGLKFKVKKKLSHQPSAISHQRIILIHTFHGHVLDGYFGHIKRKIFICIEQFLACFTDRIIAVSESVKTELLEFKIGSAGKIVVIPLGLELSRFLNSDYENQKLSKRNYFNIGIVGRLVPIKNHRMFLDVAKKIHSDNVKKVKFVIVGDGELRMELESYAAQLGIKEIVEFTGWQRYLEHVYPNLDVVCLTSLNEGTPVSLIEAMAAGRPVVATDVGGVKDIMGIEADNNIYETQQKQYRISNGFVIMNNGILVKANDVDGFVEAIKFLLENRELNIKIGEKASNFVISRFGKERLASDVKKIYNELMLVK